MTIGEICQHNVTVVPGGESIVDAAKRMRINHVGDVIVVEQRSGSRIPVGILTDRDIVVSIVASDPGHLPFLRVTDAMSSELITANEAMGVAEALELMRTRGIRRLPVVNASGALVGILTTDDLVQYLADEVKNLAQLLAKEQELERQHRL